MGSCVFEERLDMAARLRSEGNECFKNGDLDEALKLYKRSLYHSRFEEMLYNYELMDEHREKVDAEVVPCYLNMAAVELKQESWSDAIRQCSEVLKRDEKNVKA